MHKNHSALEQVLLNNPVKNDVWQTVYSAIKPWDSFEARSTLSSSVFTILTCIRKETKTWVQMSR